MSRGQQDIVLGFYYVFILISSRFRKEPLAEEIPQHLFDISWGDQILIDLMHTPGSMNSLFCDFLGEFGRGILGGVWDYFGEVSKGNLNGNQRKQMKTRERKL